MTYRFWSGGWVWDFHIYVIPHKCPWGDVTISHPKTLYFFLSILDHPVHSKSFQKK